MKTRILPIILCICGFIMSAEAQSVSNVNSNYSKGERKVASGIYYGWADIEGFDTNYSIGLELIGGKYVADKIFLQSGFCFHDRNYGVDYGSRDSQTQNEGEISVPLLVGYTIPIKDMISLDVYTGPRMNYALYGKIEYKEDGETEKVKYKDIDEVERFHINWNIGAYLYFGKWGVSFQYRPALKDGFLDYFNIGIIIR